MKLFKHYYSKYKVNIPEGESGGWKIEKFSVSEEEAKIFNIRASFSFTNRGQYIEPGDYTKLTYQGRVIMSDTPSEIRDHLWFINKANGNVLLNGLGLGVALQAVLQNEDVNKVVVNEISEDVIKLVSPSFKSDRLIINNIDAFKYKPNGMRFDYIWHDIWADICKDNLLEMKALHRRYGHWLQGDKIQGSWRRESLG
jgi:hypothetical protein